MPYLTQPTPDPEPIDCRILTAALELFVTRGYHRVSIHDVQKVANVSIGSIYNYYGGKEGVAKALYLHLINELDEMVDSVLQQPLTSVEKCNRVIELLFEYTESKSSIIAFVFHAKHREFINDEAPIFLTQPFTKLRSMLQQGMEQGEIVACDSSIAVATLFGSAIHMIHLRLDGAIEKPLAELYEQFISAIWKGMGTGSDS